MKRKEPLIPEANNSNPTFNSELLESDVGIIALHTFGYDSLKTIFAADSITQEITQKSILQNVNVWIHKELEEMEPQLGLSDPDNRPGRLGHPQVTFDGTTQVGAMVVSADRLHAQAHSNFCSVKANVCLYSGKWQYELKLATKGVMQLGWSMAEGEFTSDMGVGDTVYSFAFDGNRVRKWNVVTSEYGEAWEVGDVIGSSIDLDLGSIHFYRNGKDLGEAFSSIPLGPGHVYYPAISLAFEEKVIANFGSSPFKYPIEPYLPIQKPPTAAVIRANQLLYWLYRISNVSETKLSLKENIVDSPPKKQSFQAASILVCEILIRQLSQFLKSPYIIEACIVPFLHDITSVTLDKGGLPNVRSLLKLNFFCDTLILLLEPGDFMELINAICKCLLQNFSQTSLSLEYTLQKNSLAILSDISQNTNIRIILLKQPDFMKTSLTKFMDLRPIDVQALKECVPQSWWHSMEPHKGKLKNKAKQNYFANCRNVNVKTLELEALQEKVLMLFLNNNDGTATEPSSRKLFIHRFRLFLKDNHITGLVSFFLNNQDIEQTPLPIAFSLFHRLVNVLRDLWEKECTSDPVHVPISLFYNGSVDYFTIDRLGGVLSYLIHTFRSSLVEDLGEGHRILNEPTNQPSLQPSVQIQVRRMDTSTGVVSSLTHWINVSGVPENSAPVVVAPNPLSNSVCLTQLLDGLILLYNIAVHKHLHRISTLRNDVDRYVTTLNNAKSNLILARKTCPEAAVDIEMSIKTLELKLDDQSRVLMAWVRSTVLTSEKRANLVWLLKAVLMTLEMASQKGDLFSFVPDFYIETMVEICSALRNYFSPTLPLEDLRGYKELLVQVAEFLVRHFSDSRIVNLGSKDTIIEALAGFISKKQTMECLESISLESQEKFIGQLLKPYDNRPWGQSNWILMRIWQGCGFAFRYQKSPHLGRKLGPRTPSSDSSLLIHQAFEPSPSIQYQLLVAKILTKDPEGTAEFLNSVLKQLNWSFSEFISMMQEIQNLSKRPERVIIDARQLKICATCFDFVIGLLRVLEMLCTICLPVFTDLSIDSTENLLERLCQLLGQILLRITTPTGCFAHVVSLEVPDLDSIDQFPVLSAVVGVLIALLAQDISQKGSATMSRAAKSLLSEPAFQVDSLKYVLGLANVHEKQEPFSFETYSQAVSASELNTVSELISILTTYKANMSLSKDVDEEELCPICCAMPLAVTFMPCHHQSCKSCITHHLMDCKECFFCKTAIKSVVATDGKLLFDSTASTHKSADIERSPL